MGEETKADDGFEDLTAPSASHQDSSEDSTVVASQTDLLI